MNSSSGTVDDWVPAVDPLDLQRVFTMMSTVHAMSTAHGQQSGMIDLGINKRLCSPEADAEAVSYRASILLMLFHLGLARKDEHDKVKDEERDRLFEVAARFPMKRMEPGVRYKGGLPFDVNEFMKQLTSAE